ncbi:hypothetical protein OSTOST_10821 [Ostertagia ostertagi]
MLATGSCGPLFCLASSTFLIPPPKMFDSYSISQTTTMLAGQQQEINRALLSVTHRDADVSRVEEGISTIKSLLLSHNNFAPIIAPTAKTAQLPSWQRQQARAESSSPASAVNSGYTTPPANYKNGTDDLGSDEALSSDSV